MKSNTEITGTYFKDAVEFARSLGGPPKKSFLNQLSVLNRIKRNYDKHAKEAGIKSKLIIYHDFPKYSFGWSIQTKHPESKWKTVFNGGFICHGLEQTFAIELNAPKGIHWSIHT